MEMEKMNKYQKRERIEACWELKQTISEFQNGWTGDF